MSDQSVNPFMMKSTTQPPTILDQKGNSDEKKERGTGYMFAPPSTASGAASQPIPFPQNPTKNIFNTEKQPEVVKT